MKKILLFLVAILLLGVVGVVGGTYFMGSKAQEQVAGLDKNDFVTIEKNDFNRGFTTSSGSIAGQISKDRLKEIFTLAQSFNQFSDENSAEKIDAIEKFDHEFRGIDFRYDYSIKHFAISGKVEQSGDVTITTPKIAEALKELFGTDKPLHIKTVTSFGGTNVEISLKDMNYEDKIIKGLKIISDIDNDKKMQNLNIKVDSLDIPAQVSIGGFEGSFDFDEPTSLDEFLYFPKNYSYDVKAKFISIADAVSLSMINDQGKVKTQNGVVGVEDSAKLGSFVVGDFALKNIDSKLELKIDEKFIDNHAKIEEYAKNNDDEGLRKLFADSMKKGFEMNIKELNFENTKANKLSLKLEMAGKENDLASALRQKDESKIFNSLKFGGEIKSDSSVAEFGSAYPQLAGFVLLFGSVIEQYTIKNGNGFSLNFDLQGSKFRINNREILDLNQKNNAFGGRRNLKKETLDKSVENFNYLLSDVEAFRIAMGEYAQEGIDYMTNAPLDTISPSEAYLLSNGKRCIKISIVDDKITLQKGTDSNDKFCQDLYNVDEVRRNLR